MSDSLELELARTPSWRVSLSGKDEETLLLLNNDGYPWPHNSKCTKSQILAAKAAAAAT
jgi:hypothetical protein